MNKKYSVDEAITRMLNVKSIAIIVGVAIVCALAGVLFKGQQAVSVSYRAFTSIQVDSVPKANDKDKNYVFVNPSDAIMLNTYKENLQTRRVLTDVQRRLDREHISVSVADIRDMATTEVVSGTSIIKIILTGGDAKVVKAAARAYGKAALSEYKRTMTVGTALVSDSGSSTQSTQSGMSRKEVLFYAGVLGFILAFIGVFLSKYLDPKVQSRQYVSVRMGIDVLNDAAAPYTSAQVASDLMLATRAAHDVAVLIEREADLARVNELSDQIKDWQGGAVGGDVALQAILVTDPQARLTLSSADAVVALVEHGVTHKDFVLRANEIGKMAGLNMIGAIYVD